MTFKDFCQTVSEITNLPLEKVEVDASFQDDLAIDSLQMVNLIVELSSRYGVHISQIRNQGDLQTVGSMYKIIVREG